MRSSTKQSRTVILALPCGLSTSPLYCRESALTKQRKSNNDRGGSCRTFESYADWIRQARETHEVIEQRRSACGASLTQYRAAEATGDPPTSDLKLWMVLAGDAPPLIGDVGFGRFKCHVHPGRFAVAGANIGTEFVGSGPYELLALTLPWRTLQEDLENLMDMEAGHLGPKIHTINPDDALVGQALRCMWSSIPGADECDDRLRFDGFVNVLIDRLLQLGDIELRRPKRLQRLCPGSLASVLEYVESTISTRVSLEELAVVAGCSRFHFSRLFRASVGTSPASYVARRRLEKVKEALTRKPTTTLPELAARFGYSDESHLVRQFRQQFGEPPKRWLLNR